MKRLLFILLSVFLYSSLFAAEELKERLLSLKGISSIESLRSDNYKEKYLLEITQLLDHKDSLSGTFTQRVVVNHIGFDRPTILVTEGYGGGYALRTNYRDELSALFDANVVFVEHRYFLESTPVERDWKYLTAENAAYDLHYITTTFKQLYQGKWISTGISKGGQTTILYCVYFPDDVDIFVPYVAPWSRAVEDGRHEPFLRKVGTKSERKTIEKFQIEVLKRREEIMPLLEQYCRAKGLEHRAPLETILDYVVLEYPFAFWQWGTSIERIPELTSETETLFRHLVNISEPDYFAQDQGFESFFVQAARELGYYGYDTEPFQGYLSIESSEGYLNSIMLPEGLSFEFDDTLYKKGYNYLKENDPKMICIYGGRDPWSATRVPDFEGKKNLQIYIQPKGDHLARISNMPKKMKKKILSQLNEWLAE